MTVTLGQILQIAVFLVTVVGAYWRLSIRVTRNEISHTELLKMRGLYDRVIKMETISEVHAGLFGKLEHTLERIERKLDDKMDKS